MLTYYVQNGWLDRPVRSVYRRPRGALGWQQAVISLQTLLGAALVVGGRTALELQGFAHYISREVRAVYLYGPRKPPPWLAKLGLPQRFIYRNSGRLFQNEPPTRSFAWNTRSGESRDFERLQGGGPTSMAWGQWDWPLALSHPERAYLELLDELPKQESFDHADKLMEGAVNFSPRRLQDLLVNCRSVKVKRLFFFFADRHQHRWLKRLDSEAVDFGSGNRTLVKNGRFDSKYLLMVPKDLDAH